MNDLKFTRTHEWIQSSSGEEAIIGITDHAQELLGDMVFVELPELGEQVALGDELGVVESVKAASDFYAPASGVVIAINQEVINNPAIVNKDPFQEGWLVRLRLSNPNELNELLSYDQYQDELNKDN